MRAVLMFYLILEGTHPPPPPHTHKVSKVSLTPDIGSFWFSVCKFRQTNLAALEKALLVDVHLQAS